MKNKLKALLANKVSCVTIVAALVIIGGFAYSATNNDNKGGDADSVSLRLKWIHQAQFAGYYIADKEGVYRDSGLKVEINPAGPNISPIQMVTSGANDFGIIGGSELLEARMNNVPVVAIATIFQKNPSALISLKKSNINSPRDLIGKRIGVSYGNDEDIYREFLRLNNIDAAQTTEVASVPGPSQLLSDRVDALMAYALSVPVQLDLQGIETNVMHLADDSNPAYGDTLFTTEEMIRKHPEKVRKFVQASLEGWRMALANQTAAVDEVMRINPSLDREAQAGYLKGSESFIGNLNALGKSNGETWERMQTVLLRTKKDGVKLDVSEVFTNQFIN